MILPRLILEILGILFGIVLLWEAFVAIVQIIFLTVLLFIYFPIVAILDMSVSSAWRKVKEELP